MIKIKLLIVTPYFYPKIGGMENYAFNISKCLMKNYNYEIIVITSNHESKRYKEEKLEGMKIYRLPYQFKVSNTPISFKWKRQIKKIIEKEKPDIINAHTPVPFISDVTCRVAHKLKIPFVLTYHAVTLYKKWYSPWNIIIFLQRLFMGDKTINQATKIIAVSDFVKLQFNKKIRDKTDIVYNAISERDVINNKYTLKKYNLIFINNLNKAHSWKGLKDIILSIKIYKDKFNRQIKLIVVGDGNYRNYYEDLIKENNLENNVIFVGQKFGEEKEKLISESRILITYPNTANDAFPTVFLEAWANNLPIIASNIGAIPYLIKDKEDGFLVESNNFKKLAEGIHDLLENKRLQEKIIKNGNKKVKENFTWDISTKKMNKIIQGVLR
jgi:glycosyltransferase involved in cell wall biosynthesis